MANLNTTQYTAECYPLRVCVDHVGGARWCWTLYYVGNGDRDPIELRSECMNSLLAARSAAIAILDAYCPSSDEGKIDPDCPDGTCG